MPSALKAVLFDLDGTLLDTAPEFYQIVSIQLQKHGAAPIAFNDFREVVSDGARGMVQKAFGIDPGAVNFEPLRQEFLNLYTRHLAMHTHLFPGMAETLAFIESENLRWGVVTNKPVGFSAPLLQKLNLSTRCATLICPDHVKQRKPDPEALILACAQIGCAVGEAIYLGDHRRDIECARRAGMPSIACDYGYIHADDPCSNWGADFIVPNAAAIVPILQKFIY
ncbi:MAG TPA: HAD-IA family hydrolase [Spongiibacteraceae bacterium]|nr:HAD-IA family hydrolase [Spongiibacteraceae bacterium]